MAHCAGVDKTSAGLQQQAPRRTLSGTELHREFESELDVAVLASSTLHYLSMQATRTDNHQPVHGLAHCAGSKTTAPLQRVHHHTLSELRLELDRPGMAKQRLDPSWAGAASATAKARMHHGDCDVYTSLPTTFNWERTNTRTDGLLDCAMGEIQAMQDEDGVCRVRCSKACAGTQRQTHRQ